MIRAFLLVGLGGSVGSMLRYGVSYFISKNYSQPFPLATFIVNIIGCFLIGLLFGLAEKYQWMQGNYLLLLATGFCGGFTTFSTFALENVGLMDKGFSMNAIFYTLLSLALGISFCKVGLWITS